MHTTDDKSNNREIIDILSLIASYYTTKGDTFRSRSFRNASDKLSKYDQTIISGSQVREDIKGIGKSIGQVIDEYISTGQVRRLIELEETYNDQKTIIDIFLSIYGIGPVSAAKFYNKGYRTLEDLWDSEELNDKQKLGYIWREHINLRISRNEIDLIKEQLGVMLNSHNIRWKITGSYRRKESSSGDIDMLAESAHGFDMNRLISYLQPILPVTLAIGPTKFMGMIRLSDRYNAHRFDVRLVESEHWPFALMYFTGSQKFNILMRQRAIDLGLSLNEYTLTNEVGGSIYSNSEEEIFEILGVKYIPPIERVRDLDELELSR